ncbi:hypothetical protein K438DRAFT_1050797 [Mycena galopus ATCC 62051]|nr:hypothetical protein K438DRAFT_1050797 [Mycena galopus ATCC 62051]
MPSPASSGTFSMSSPSSSAVSLTTRGRPRPRSPPSMYVPYETSTAKPPKPLLKLDKKGKAKAPPATSALPDTLPPRARALTSAASSPGVPNSPNRRPSISSFLSLRRKNAGPSFSPAIPTARPRNVTPPPLSPHSVGLHETNVHPVDDIRFTPTPTRLDKASRMLGKQLSLEILKDARGIIVSDFSGRSPRPSSPDEEGDDDQDFEDECFIDDAHIRRQSRLISPIEFAAARPPSAQFTRPPPLEQDDDEWSTPVTPTAELPTFRQPSPRDLRRDSYTSIHNHYSTETTPESAYMQFRPDTPFLDTLVAVNATSPRHRHAREPSVIRAETKEGWRGEWNQDDMQDVIHKLRSLK